MAGYIGNKAVGLNVTTGDILGDVGVGGDYFSKSLGTSNLRLGVNAGDSIASGGNFNVCVGDEAGTAITTGDQNTAVGALALNANISSSFNTAVGQESMLKTTGASNTALGDKSMLDNVAGANNVALGASALENNTTASENTAVGYRAGFTNTTGAELVAIGERALFTNTTGTYNTALGRVAMFLNTTGSNNTAVGNNALRSNTTASNNTAVGYQAGYTNVAAGAQVFVGYKAGYATTTGGGSSTFVGHEAGLSNTTGGNNTALGRGAFLDNTTGTNNVALGFDALANNTTSSQSVAIGFQAGKTQTTVGANTFVGNDSGRDVTGQQNAFYGHDSGRLVTSGDKNTIIGSYDGNQNSLDLRTSDNNIVLSDGDGYPRTKISGVGQQIHRGDENGNLGDFIASWTMFGTNTDGLTVGYSGVTPNNASRYFYRGGDASVIRYIVFSNGNVVNTNNSYGAISDVKLKENIIDASSQWDDIKALTVRKYSLKSDELDAPNMLGVIAQEVEAAGMSGLINDTPDFDRETREDLGTVTKTVNYSILYMKAVKALQEAMTRIETLETKVAALEG